MGDSKNMGELADMFNNPVGFQILPYKHNHTKSGDYVESGFFVASYEILIYDKLKRESTIDNRGVTDTKKAIDYYERSFNALLGSPKDYLRDKAEYCFTPEDAFAFEGDNQFNTVLLAEQQANIKLFKKGPKIDIGNLEYRYKNNQHIEEAVDGVVFKEDKFNGKVHVLEQPIVDKSGNVPRNLYVAGIDGIDMGGEDTSDNTRDPSSFAVIVFKRAVGLEPPKPVAFYMDRPEKIKDAHLTCLKLLQWYNAQACLESTRISIQQFFRQKKCADKYLMRRPRACLSDMQNGRSKQFGAPATETVIRHQLDLISDYIDEYCNEIWFIELIEELLKYSYENKRKFDLVAAFGQVMLANEELMFVKPKIETETSNQFVMFGYWIDSRGIRHKGKMPTNEQPKFTANPWLSYEDTTRFRTSDSRYVT